MVRRRQIDGGCRGAGAVKVDKRTVVRTSLGDADAMTTTKGPPSDKCSSAT